ncbi:hypothetical protein ACS0TY_030300 [Phlomoides rotata]
MENIDQYVTLIELQDSRSVAGLAFAVIFTWRLLTTPRGPQRRQAKRPAASASSSGVANAGSSADSGTQNVIHEFF